MEDEFSRLSVENFSDYFFQGAVNYSQLVSKGGALLPPEVRALTLLHHVLSPVIIVIGLAGNSLSLGVYLNQRQPAHRNCFLAALACADNCFLLSTFVTWLDKLVPLTQGGAGCSGLLFVNYTSSSLSSWFILCFTAERFIYVRFPLRAPVLCSRHRQKVLTLLLLPLAAGLYSFPLWTVDAQPSVSRSVCITNFRYLSQVKAFTWTDTTLTMILPFILMSAMNLNSFLLIQRQTRTRILLLQGGLRQARPPCLRVTSRPLSANTAKLRLRLTKVLIIVSTAFLVLNLPAHATRLHKLLGRQQGGMHWYNTAAGQVFDAVIQLMYLASFSVNFLLYTTRNNNFKTAVCSLSKAVRASLSRCCRCKFPRSSREDAPAHTSLSPPVGSTIASPELIFIPSKQGDIDMLQPIQLDGSGESPC